MLHQRFIQKLLLILTLKKDFHISLARSCHHTVQRGSSRDHRWSTRTHGLSEFNTV